MLKNASAMIAEREALRKGIEHLTVLFPTVVSSFDFQVENSGRTVQYKLNAQSLRLFGLHSDVNDAHRADANRLQNKNKTFLQLFTPLHTSSTSSHLFTPLHTLTLLHSHSVSFTLAHLHTCTVAHTLLHSFIFTFCIFSIFFYTCFPPLSHRFHIFRSHFYACV